MINFAVWFASTSAAEHWHTEQRPTMKHTKRTLQETLQLLIFSPIHLPHPIFPHPNTATKRTNSAPSLAIRPQKETAP